MHVWMTLRPVARHEAVLDIIDEAVVMAYYNGRA